MFNDSGYEKLADQGKFMIRKIKDRHPAPRFLPFCTRSQMLVYLDRRGEKVAEVHQYLQPDETLGASGKPDPKMLVHDGVLYVVTTLRGT